MHVVRALRFSWLHIIFLMVLKSISNLVSAAEEILAGAQSQIVAAGHVNWIKSNTIA